MKYSTLFLFLSLSVFSCVQEEVTQSNIPEGYRLPTQEELADLGVKGIVQDASKGVTCNWGDGQYGDISCNGTCSVLFQTAQHPMQACIFCSVNNVYTTFGACRPI